MLSVLRSIVQQVNAAKDLEQTFDIIVKQICQSMKADICSVYLLNKAASHLRLVANEGLNPDLVGKAKIAINEGIVGFVARREEPVNIDDASRHEAFYYLPDSGEIGAKAFLGVPLLHHRQVLGVLVIQQYSERGYTEDDVSFLITLSAQLAGIIATAEVRQDVEPHKRGRHATTFTGSSAVPGIAIAKGWIAGAPGVFTNIPDRPVDDVDEEISRLRKALASARKEIRALGQNLAGELPKQQMALFDAYEKILSYNSLGRKVEAQIKSQSIWAPAALRHIIESDVQQFYQFEDPYLQERATDLLDLGRRVLAHLDEENLRKRNYTKNIILIAEHLTSAMIAEVPPRLLKGVISIHGSSTSHAAIIARSMGIPAVMGIHDCPLDLLENRSLIIDGYNNELIVSPSRATTQEYRERQKKEQKFFGKLTQKSGQRVHTKTKDGQRIQLLLNLNPFHNEKIMPDINVDGVGLYRTEYLYMQYDRFPGEQEQINTYRSLLEAHKSKPVVLRTLDIGGDKSLSYFPINEKNPFLGWRGIRVTLDHPEIFTTQLRAMLIANEGLGNLHISLPMISNLDEIDRALKLIKQVHKELLDQRQVSKKQLPLPKIGAIIEVPSAVYQIRAIVKRVDFISIGSNDLTQYLFATDRNNTRVSYLYNSLHPAVLLALAEICKAANQQKIPVHICGEIAGNPLATILLLALGISAFSMNVLSVPKIRLVVRKFSLRDAKKVLSRALACENAQQVQACLMQVFTEHDLLQLIDPVAASE